MYRSQPEKRSLLAACAVTLGACLLSPCITRCNAEPASESILTNVQAAQIDFAFQLYRAQTASTKNILCSPYDLFETLTLFEFAADGLTQTELRAVTSRSSNRQAYCGALERIRQSGLPTRPTLGTKVSENDGYGVRINEVAAWQDRLSNDDLIFTVDDEPIRKPQELFDIVATAFDQLQVSGYDVTSGRPFERAISTRRVALKTAKPANHPLLFASGLWLRRGIDPSREFAQLVTKHFDAHIGSGDLSDSASLEKQVADFFSTQLAGRATSPYRLPVLTKETAFIALNAVDFEREWDRPFDKKRTTTGDFASFQQQKFNALYMNQTDWFKFKRHETYSTIDLPYLDSSLSMLLVLPHTIDNFQQVEREFISDRTLFASAITAEPEEVAVTIPRFSIRHDGSGKEILKQLGIHQLFGRKADLSVMLGPQAVGKVWLDDIYQQITIDVNEQGTKAGSHTTAVGVALSASQVAKFDARHPFLFFIHDAAGVIFFAGRVAEPTQTP